MKGHTPHSLEHISMYLDNKNAFLHYTCNAPNEDILVANGINMLGFKFGCQNDKEVVLIPKDKYLEKFSPTENKYQLRLNLEILLRDMGE